MENFKLVLFVDGSDDMPLDLETTGERAGFGLFIQQNDQALFLPGFSVEGRVEDDDTLVVEVRNANGNVIASNRTRRRWQPQSDLTVGPTAG